MYHMSQYATGSYKLRFIRDQLIKNKRLFSEDTFSDHHGPFRRHAEAESGDRDTQPQTFLVKRLATVMQQHTYNCGETQIF